MTPIEYKVVPAPTKAKRGRWMRSSAVRFADRLQHIFNEQAKDGWEYVRTDTLPCEERHGLTQKVTTYQNLLVFKRLPEVILQIEDQTEAVALIAAPEKEDASDTKLPATLFENGGPVAVEETPPPPKPTAANVVTPAAWFHTSEADDIDAEVIEEISPALLSRLKQVNSDGAA